MNVPLGWLSEYVKLPKTEKELTDKLTLIGHMLDKQTGEGKTRVIDLELRGNRSDLFSIVGIAREISAAWNTQLTPLEYKKLPKVDPKSKLVDIQASDLVERFTGFTLRVSVSKSPEWLVQKLALYGVPSINNVVDITNFVMLETGEPMHAYDLAKLAGKKLIVRRAKAGERMTTLAGSTITFTKEDLVIADNKIPQGTAIIGSQTSGVTAQTTEILLEAAVYNQANVRRTARRLGVRTEAGNRHEKLLDPNQVIPALERAYFLLTKYTQARATSDTADILTKPRKTIAIDLALDDIPRLTGVDVPHKSAENYLIRLGFTVDKKKKNSWSVVAPTFRTDIEQSADVVEEIIRLYGYDKIPTQTLIGTPPEPNTYPLVTLTEEVRNILVALGQNEVITSPIIENSLTTLYEQQGKFETPVILVNAPDTAIATMRPSLLPNLLEYAKRNIGFRQKRIALFEIGKIYAKIKKEYHETNAIGLVMHGEVSNSSWNKQPRELSIYDLKGVVEGLCNALGITPVFTIKGPPHPSMDEHQSISIFVDGEQIGALGQIQPKITNEIGLSVNTFVAEISLNQVMKLRRIQPQPYVIAPSFPPTLEDFTFPPNNTPIQPIIDKINSLDNRIEQVHVKSLFKGNVTISVAYASNMGTLTSSEVKPIRDSIIQIIENIGAEVKK